jgi:hypothetical protein
MSNSAQMRNHYAVDVDVDGYQYPYTIEANSPDQAGRIAIEKVRNAGLKPAFAEVFTSDRKNYLVTVIA